MLRLRDFARSRLIAALIMGLAVLCSLLPATAVAENEFQRAIENATSALAVIETTNSVDVTIDLSGTDLASFSGTYGPYEFSSGGTGFFITPDGIVVTASHVVDVDEAQARTVGANLLVFSLLNELGLEYTLNEGDEYEQWTIDDNPDADALLQGCYDGTICSFETSAASIVYPSGTGATGGGLAATVLVSTGYEATDVAILKVATQGMATVTLAESVATLEVGDEVALLGFPGSTQGLPTVEPTTLFGRVSNVRPTGQSQQIEVDADGEPGMSGGPAVTAQGLVVGLTSWHAVQDGNHPGVEYLVAVDDIRAALAQVAGVTLTTTTETTTDEPRTIPAPAADPVPAAEANEDGGFPTMLVGAAVGLLAVIGSATGFVVLRRRAVNVAEPESSIESVFTGQWTNGHVAGSPALTPLFGNVNDSAEAPLAEPGARVTVLDAPTEPNRFCIGCGSALIESARFCGSCGAAVR